MELFIKILLILLLATALVTNIIILISTIRHDRDFKETIKRNKKLNDDFREKYLNGGN
jgi:hypothetical protein